ncbi:MAG: Sua5 YciO YrdC YwlC family protein [Sulfurovum sp.]|nr:Sua5 YciO YrdC YwlC family protein [Sulfurovaceae bacterium]
MLKYKWSKKVFLTPTDTTIGFISKSSYSLDKVKKRLSDKEYITALSSLQKLKLLTRVPFKYKNMVRRANKTTFIFPNKRSYRLIKNVKHKNLIDKLDSPFTTSANLSGKEYQRVFAEESSDIIISFPISDRSHRASHIFKISSRNIKRIR